jgi:hypothetical protein
MLSYNKWQKRRVERVTMKKEKKVITWSVIIFHYNVMALGITRWIRKVSNTAATKTNSAKKSRLNSS